MSISVFRPVFALIWIAISSTLVMANPMELDVFTDFEPPDTGTVLTIGESPVSATFTGGNSTIIGIGHLYHSGGFSWLVEAGATGIINFETPASIVEFFAVDQFDANDGIVTAFSPNDEMLDSIELTTTFSSPMGDFSNPLTFADLGPIGRIELTNTMGISAIDDLGFSPFDEPEPISFQNMNNQYDVDDNMIVNALDLLKIIRDLNEFGNRSLAMQMTDGMMPPPFMDINGDEIANPLDIALMVTELNRLAQQVDAFSPNLNTASANLVESVPEPSSWQLALFGLLGMGGYVSFRRLPSKKS